MVVHQPDQQAADRVFHALADATRRDIVARTLHREHSITDLARLYPMSFAAVQKHVAVLQEARLVTKRRHGRSQLVAANPEALDHARRLLDDLERLWRARLDQFAAVLAEDAAPAANPAPTTRRSPEEVPRDRA